jgi:hypothetical protein
MQISKAIFADPPQEADPIWRKQLDVEGSGFQHRAAPLLARVGNVPVEAVIIKAQEDGFIGLLRAIPPDGAELQVGYLDSGLVNTGFIYPSPPADV